MTYEKNEKNEKNESGDRNKDWDGGENGNQDGNSGNSENKFKSLKNSGNSLEANQRREDCMSGRDNNNSDISNINISGRNNTDNSIAFLSTDWYKTHNYHLPANFLDENHVRPNIENINPFNSDLTDKKDEEIKKDVNYKEYEKNEIGIENKNEVNEKEGKEENFDNSNISNISDEPTHGHLRGGGRRSVSTNSNQNNNPNIGIKNYKNGEENVEWVLESHPESEVIGPDKATTFISLID